MPKEHALQQLGLTIANATALHIRDIKDGTLVEPTEANDEDLTSDTNLTTGLPASQHEDASDLGTSAPHLWTQESAPALATYLLSPTAPQPWLSSLPMASRVHTWFAAPHNG